MRRKQKLHYLRNQKEIDEEYGENSEELSEKVIERIIKQGGN